MKKTSETTTPKQSGTEPPIFSGESLAKLLHCSPATVSRWRRRQNWLFGAPPWSAEDVEAIQQWVRDRRQACGLGDQREQEARIKLIVERTAKLKLEREIAAGCYVRKEDVEKAAVRKVYAARALLQEIPLRASLIAHRPERECERILTDWVKGVCDCFASTAAPPQANAGNPWLRGMPEWKR